MPRFFLELRLFGRFLEWGVDYIVKLFFNRRRERIVRGKDAILLESLYKTRLARSDGAVGFRWHLGVA